MANEEHLKILEQGVEVWNQWRGHNQDIQPDLHAADLSEVNLTEADLKEANLEKANLFAAKLKETQLIKANLSSANLSEANLYRTNLSQANLNRADLSGAYLGGANLTKTDLGKANLSRAYLDNANLREAIIGYTTFLNVDLSLVKGLDTVKHYGPSYIDVHTLYRSGGSIPEIFLRKAGIPNEFINYLERIKTPECLYTLEQLDEWIKNLQKRLTIVSRNLDDRKEVKALHGPLNIPLSLNNEIHALEQEQENIEAQIIEHKRLKTLYYS